MYQFNFSESHIRKTNRNMLIGFSFLFLCALGFALFISDFDVSAALPAVGVPCLIMASILAIEKFLIDRSLHKMKVLIYEDKIIKQCGKQHQTILWDNIIKIKLNENPEGNIVWIRLYQTNERVIYLNGFDEMEKIVHLIREKISDNVLVQTKRYRLDPGSPIVPVIIGVSIMIIMCIVASGGTKAINIFAILFTLCVGFLFLICRPLTKSNLSYKWLEIILAVFLIIMGICRFIVFLFTGGLP